MTAGIYSFKVEAGATWTRQLTWRDGLGALVPLVGLGARMQVRASVSSETVALELSSATGEIVLDSPGIITLTMTAAQTSALGSALQKGTYDLEITSGAGPTEVVTRLLQGGVVISPEVTRP